MTTWAITGGTGSLGQTLVARLLADDTVERVCILSRHEPLQARVMERFEYHPKLRPFIADVRETPRLLDAFQGVDVVVHAAALKRVDVGAYEPYEMAQTNVVGTQNVLRAARICGVKRVVVVSSDKACEPWNIYGASKFMAECIAINSNVYSPGKTEVMVVRYGNVLGSTESVVHTWRRQAAAGRPLTITDPACTRFVITLADAVSFVLDVVGNEFAGALVVPVLRAATVAQLAAATAPGHPTLVSHLRSGGEKRHETLLSAGEVLRAGRRLGHYTVWPDEHPWGAVPGRVDPLPQDFVYTSETSERYTVEELTRLVAEVPG